MAAAGIGLYASESSSGFHTAVAHAVEHEHEAAEQLCYVIGVNNGRSACPFLGQRLVWAPAHHHPGRGPDDPLHPAYALARRRTPFGFQVGLRS